RRRVFCRNIVAVHEVKTLAVVYALPDRMCCALVLPDLVPAHMRHFEPFTVFFQLMPEKINAAREQVNTTDALVFLTAVQQGLHADTDTQQGPVAADFADQLVDAEAAHLGHTVTDGADTGKNYVVCIADNSGIGGNLDPYIRCHMLNGLADGMEVAHAIIDDSDGFHSNLNKRQIRCTT